MKILDKIGRSFRELFESPLIENMWEITRVGDVNKFMEFVLSNAADSDFWYLESAFLGKNKSMLESLGMTKKRLPLSKSVVAKLINVLSKLNVEEYIAHSIGNDNKEFLLVSYDNLTCCWLSKRISEDRMIKASKIYDFDFEDTESEG